MTTQQERLIRAQLKGLRPTILLYIERRSGLGHCHETLGRSLNALRETVLEGLSEEERKVTATGMPAIIIEHGGDCAVSPTEAFRLLSQLEEVMSTDEHHSTSSGPDQTSAHK